MEIQTQTFKHLNVVDVIQKIHNNQPLSLPKKPEITNKSILPYIELYNSQKQNKKLVPVFALKYHQKLFSLNKKIKAKEFAHFHHHTIESNDSLVNLSPLIGRNDSLIERKSKYLKSKDFFVSRSVEYRSSKQEKKDFGKLFVVGSKPSNVIPSHLKLPSLGEINKC